MSNLALCAMLLSAFSHVRAADDQPDAWVTPAIVADERREVAFPRDDPSGRPLFLVFVKNGCPCNKEMQPYVNSLNEAYGSRVRFAAVFDGNAAEAREWAKANRVTFPVLLDPKLSLIGRYNVTTSTQSILLGKSAEEWPGYSQSIIKAIGQRLSEVSGLDEHSLKLDGLPEATHNGCDY